MWTFWRVAPALLLAACSLNLDVPEGTVVNCSSNADCPSTARCNPLSNACDFDTGAEAPSLFITSTGDGTTRAVFQLAFSFDALDGNAPPLGNDTARYAIEYSVAGGRWCNATVLGSAPPIAAVVSRVDLTWNVLADARNASGECALAMTTLVTDAADDAAPVDAVAYRANIRLRITATDNSGASSSVTSLPFAIGNDAPILTLAPGSTRFRQATPLEYTLTDTSFDQSELDIQYRISGGATWNTATLRGAANGLAGDPTDAPQLRLVVWQADAPAPGGLGATNGNVELRARAVERVIAGAATYGPWSSLAGAVRNQNAPIVSSLRLFDAESDAVDIRVEYTIGNGGPRPATPYPILRHSGTRGLPASADVDRTFTFVWNVGADIKSYTTDVSISVTAADDGAIGPTVRAPMSIPIGLAPSSADFDSSPSVTSLPTVSSGANSPIQVDLADFNCDGVDDYIVERGSRFDIFIADTLPPHFPLSPPRTTSIGRGRAFRVTELNHDNCADLLLYSEGDSIFVVLGRASGLVRTELIGLYTQGTAVIATGDFNGDGNVDLAHDGGQSADVRLGDGLGGFSTTPTSINGDVMFAMAAGDFDGDGCDDLVYSTATGDGLPDTSGQTSVPVLTRAYLGCGDNGLLGDAIDVTNSLGRINFGSGSVSGQHVHLAVARGAFGTRDGLWLFDREQSSRSRLQLFELTNGAFAMRSRVGDAPVFDRLTEAHTSEGHYIVGAPFTVTAPDNVVLYRYNSGTASIEVITPPSALLPGSLGHLALVDITGNGVAEIIDVTQTELGVRLALSRTTLFDATPLQRAAPVDASRIAVGDADGDQLSDVFTFETSERSPHVVVPYVGGVNAQRVATCALPAAASQHLLVPAGEGSARIMMPVTVGDFNGDGLVDLLTSGVSSAHVALATTNPFAFTPSRNVASGNAGANFAIADINGDTYDDVGGDASSTALGYIYATAQVVDGTFDDFASTAFGSHENMTVLNLGGDVDNDGVDDLGFTLAGRSTVVFGRVASAPVVCTLNIGSTAAAIGDLNNDGNNELVLVGGSLAAYAITDCAATPISMQE